MEFMVCCGKITKTSSKNMFTSMSSSENLAVATAPLPVPTPKARLQPVAGMTSVSPVAQGAASPLPPPLPQASSQLGTPPQNLRSTVFTSEARQQSPWTGGAARVTPKPPFTPAAALGTPAELPDMEDGIEGVRKLLFGRQMIEMQTKVAELQLSLNGEMKRLREALMSRVDEMSGYLHRDMVVLRDEMQREMAQLKTDLFTAATGLSSVKDRLISVEAKNREDAAGAIAELDARIVRQESAFSSALDHVEAKIGRAMESKCAEALAVLAKKSEIAELLTQVSTLVEKQGPAVELGWFSAGSTAPAKPQAAPAPVAARTPDAGGSGTWDALAKGLPADGSVSDWTPPVNSFMPDDSLIA